MYKTYRCIGTIGALIELRSTAHLLFLFDKDNKNHYGNNRNCQRNDKRNKIMDQHGDENGHYGEH